MKRSAVKILRAFSHGDKENRTFLVDIALESTTIPAIQKIMELRRCCDIGQWVSTQRALKSKRELTLERVTLLKDIEFWWQLRRGRLSSKINAYKAVFSQGGRVQLSEAGS